MEIWAGDTNPWQTHWQYLKDSELLSFWEVGVELS